MGLALGARAGLIFSVLALAATFEGCGGGGNSITGEEGDPTVPPSSTTPAVVSATPASATIEVGAQTTLFAQAKDAAGQVMSGVTFAWSSSNPAVATVTQGVVTGVGVGTAKITASVGTVSSGDVALTVRAAAEVSQSSELLIEQALAAGTLNAETALVYRTYAAFDSARLPDAYRGGAIGQHSGVLTEVIQRYDTLSAETQAKLLPYLQRPADQGSWLDPAVGAASAAGAAAARKLALSIVRRCLGTILGWTSVDGATSNTRIWYRYDKAGQDVMASKVLSYLETAVHPKLVGTLGFKAPADDSALLCNGGDGRLDIYLVEGLGNRGEAVPNTSDPYSSSVYISIRDSLSDEVLQHTVTHEYMHAIHWAHTTKARQEDYGWFRDAIANWATAHVYPGNRSLGEQAGCHFKSPHIALENRAVGYCAVGIKRDYGAYLPLRFFEKTLGAATVRAILVATEFYTTGAEAMDKALPEGLDKHWPLFGLRLWNQDATDKVYGTATYKVWDSLTPANVAVAEPVLAPDLPSKTSANLGGLARDETALATQLEHLSNKYYHFTFSEEPTRSLMFHNTFQPKRKAGVKVSVRAFLKPENRPWEEEDWSDYEWIGLCRDAKQQRLSDLVIVVSSAEWQPARPQAEADAPPRLMRNNIGCWGFKGTAKRTFISASWGAGGKSEAFFNPDYDYHPSGTPTQYTNRAEGRLRVPMAAPLFNKGSWRLLEGFSDGACSFALDKRGTSMSNTQGGDAASSIVIDVFNEALPDALRLAAEGVIGTRKRAYHINGVSTAFATGTVTGPDECGTTYESGIGAWLLTNAAPADAPVARTDGLLKGNFTVSRPGDGYVETFDWELVPVREP